MWAVEDTTVGGRQETPSTGTAPWRTLADGRGRVDRRPAPTLARAVLVFWLLSCLALVSILLAGTVVIRNAAQHEALQNAEVVADLLATAVVEPALEDGLLTGDPGAVERLDRVMRSRVLNEERVQVKLWTAEGLVVYSDDATLIGQTFTLDADEARVLRGGPPVAEISGQEGPDDGFEDVEDGFLEVYRHVSLPNRTHLLFEVYSDGSQVAERREEILSAFTPITVGTVVLLQLFQLPLVGTLVRRLRASQRSSERLLRQAIDASTAERRRIAGNVHDGVVQGLAGASFVIAGAVDEVERGGQPRVAGELREAARGVRESIRGLRSMLVEIYPPSVSVAGLPAALHDLVSPLRAQGIDAGAVITPPAPDMPRAVEALIFRVAQEALRNVAQHSGATWARLALGVEPGLVRLEIADDGVGFDVDEALARNDGHVGMKVLCDLAEEAGALLMIASSPGAGTTIRLEAEAL